MKMEVLATQSRPTLCNTMGCTPPGSSVHEILQVRLLQCVAIPFSRGFSQPRGQTGSPALQADSLPSEPPGNPFHIVILLCQSTFSGPTPSCPRSGSFATAQPWSRDWCLPGFAQGHSGIQLLILLFSWLFKFIPLKQPSSSWLPRFYNWNINFKIHMKFTHWPVFIF